MTRRVRILAQASEEAVEAAAWYESEHPGLGRDFQAALDAALDLWEGEIVPLTTMPGLAGRRGAKKLMLRRFPYNIAVVERPDDLSRRRLCTSIAPPGLLARPRAHLTLRLRCRRA